MYILIFAKVFQSISAPTEKGFHLAGTIEYIVFRTAKVRYLDHLQSNPADFSIITALDACIICSCVDTAARVAVFTATDASPNTSWFTLFAIHEDDTYRQLIVRQALIFPTTAERIPRIRGVSQAPRTTGLGFTGLGAGVTGVTGLGSGVTGVTGLGSGVTGVTGLGSGVTGVTGFGSGVTGVTGF